MYSEICVTCGFGKSIHLFQMESENNIFLDEKELSASTPPLNL